MLPKLLVARHCSLKLTQIVGCQGSLQVLLGQLLISFPVILSFNDARLGNVISETGRILMQ